MPRKTGAIAIATLPDFVASEVATSPKLLSATTGCTRSSSTAVGPWPGSMITAYALISKESEVTSYFFMVDANFGWSPQGRGIAEAKVKSDHRLYKPE
jgi:hypothetical protein